MEDQRAFLEKECRWMKMDEDGEIEICLSLV
jgi:hypothetical protein